MFLSQYIDASHICRRLFASYYAKSSMLSIIIDHFSSFFTILIILLHLITRTRTHTHPHTPSLPQVPGPVWESTVFRLTAGKGLDGKESVIRMRYRKECHQEVLTAVRAIQQEYPKNIPKNVRENVPDDSSLESLSLIFQIQPNPVRISSIFNHLALISVFSPYNYRLFRCTLV